jgi:hypothetical protein
MRCLDIDIFSSSSVVVIIETFSSIVGRVTRSFLVPYLIALSNLSQYHHHHHHHHHHLLQTCCLKDCPQYYNICILKRKLKSQENLMAFEQKAVWSVGKDKVWLNMINIKFTVSVSHIQWHGMSNEACKVVHSVAYLGICILIQWGHLLYSFPKSCGNISPCKSLVFITWLIICIKTVSDLFSRNWHQCSC